LQDGAGPAVEGEEVDEDAGGLAGAHQAVVLVVGVQHHERGRAQQACEDGIESFETSVTRQGPTYIG
jgi:hypothetical protein